MYAFTKLPAAARRRICWTMVWRPSLSHDAVKKHIQGYFNTSADESCPKGLMTNKAVLEHFRAWQTPTDGEYMQDPLPGHARQSLTAGGKAITITASKKSLFVPNEGGQ